MLIDIHALSHGRAATTEIETEIPAHELAVSLQEIRVDSPVHFVGRLTNAGRGAIHLEGTLSAELTGWCARCLVPVTRPVVVAVSETFRTGMTTDGAESADGSYGYRGYTLDLLPPLRDNLVLALPQRLLCREDCLGLCPVCGEDRNTTTCGCATAEQND